MTTTMTTKLQLGTVALAMAAAAVITPVAAQADSLAPQAPSLTSFAQKLGNTAGSGVSNTGGAKAKATASIFKNNVLWLGNAAFPPPTQNGAYWTDPGTTRIPGQQNFTPLWVSLGKQIFPNLKYWTTWDAGSSQTCFLGFTSALGGPYSAAGTISSGYNSKGCTP